MIPEYFKAILDLLDLELNSLRPIYCYNDINKSFMMDLSLKELTPRFYKILEYLKMFYAIVVSEKCISWEFEFIGTI